MMALRHLEIDVTQTRLRQDLSYDPTRMRWRVVLHADMRQPDGPWRSDTETGHDPRGGLIRDMPEITCDTLFERPRIAAPPEPILIVVRFQDQDIQTPESLANGVRRRTKIRSDGGGKVVGLETKNKRLSRVMRNGDWNDIYRADHSRHAGI